MTTGVRKQLRNFFISNLAVAAAAAAAARAASHMHDGTAWRGVAWQGVRVRRCGVGGGSGLLASGFMTDGGGAEIEGARKRKENLTWKDIGAV